jgi:hypothetical protein
MLGELHVDHSSATVDVEDDLSWRLPLKKLADATDDLFWKLVHSHHRSQRQQ